MTVKNFKGNTHMTLSEKLVLAFSVDCQSSSNGTGFKRAHVLYEMNKARKALGLPDLSSSLFNSHFKGLVDATYIEKTDPKSERSGMYKVNPSGLEIYEGWKVIPTEKLSRFFWLGRDY